MLCSSRLGDEDLQMAVDAYPAVVLVNRRAGQHVATVVVDDVLGGRLATGHLIGRGHRAIGFCRDRKGPIAGRAAWRGMRSRWRLPSAARDQVDRTVADYAEQGRLAALQLLRGSG